MYEAQIAPQHTQVPAPAPAPAKTMSGGAIFGIIFGVILGGAVLFFIILGVSGAGGTSWYAHYQCHRNATCDQTMASAGGDSGSFGTTYASQNECESSAAVQALMSAQGVPGITYYCSTSP